MSEEDHTPKMFPKFIQLVSHSDVLYALDENGEVYWKDVSGDNNTWRKSKAKREE